PADVHSDDAAGIVPIDRGATQGHDAGHVAGIGRREAVEDLHDQWLGPVGPEDGRTAEVVHGADEGGQLDPVRDDRALADVLVEPGGRHAAEQAPVVEHTIGRDETEGEIDAAAGQVGGAADPCLVRLDTVVVVVEARIAPGDRYVRAQLPAPEVPSSGVAGQQFGAARFAADVVGQRRANAAPSLAIAPGKAEIHAAVARVHAGQAGGHLVFREPLQAPPQEQVPALAFVLGQLEPRAARAQEKALAFVQIEQI